MHKDVKLGVAEREHKPAGVWPEELQRADGKKGGISGGDTTANGAKIAVQRKKSLIVHFNLPTKCIQNITLF